MSKDKDDFDETYAAVDELCLKSDAQKLVTEVKEVAAKVYAALGDGRVEDIYHQAMAVEFRRRNISYQTKVQMEIFYEGERVGEAEPDFIVDNRLVVELKKVDSMKESHSAQTKAYMRTLGIWNGLVVTFPPSGEPQFKRLVNNAVSPVAKDVPVRHLQRVKPHYEKYAVPISQKMKKAVEEVASMWAEFKEVEAEYDDMLCLAREFGFSENEIEASESLNWRGVKPRGRRG